MQDMILYLVFILIGAGLGFFVRKKRGNTGPIGIVNLIKSISICILLFVMSTRIGSNEEVAKNLGTIGIYGFLSVVIILAITIVLAFIFRKMLGFDARGRSMRTAAVSETAASSAAAGGADGSAAAGSSEAAEPATSDEKGVMDKTTIYILVFVALGIFCGHFFVNKIFSDYESFVKLASLMIKIWLTVLLFLVGFDLGYDESGGGDFKSAGIKIIFFPIATIAGAMIGGVIAYFIMPVTLRESLAIASGFGWYSLAPVLIMDAGHITASAISFLHNVMRELIAILIVPFVAKYVGYIEASCVPGAPGMDICLPVVERSTNSTIVIYSFITGTITSALVPILVPLFIGG